MAMCADKWAQLSDQEVDRWRYLSRVAADERMRQARLGSLVALPGRDVQSEAEVIQGIGLWGSPGKSSLVPVAKIVEECNRSSWKARRRRSFHDPTLEVLSPPRRCCAMPHPEHKPLLFGCWAETKTSVDSSSRRNARCSWMPCASDALAGSTRLGRLPCHANT